MTARARAPDAAMRCAGVPPGTDLADVESFLAFIDPNGLPGEVDHELVAQIVAWLEVLGDAARTSSARVIAGIDGR